MGKNMCDVNLIRINNYGNEPIFRAANVENGIWRHPVGGAERVAQFHDMFESIVLNGLRPRAERGARVWMGLLKPQNFVSAC